LDATGARAVSEAVPRAVDVTHPETAQEDVLETGDEAVPKTDLEVIDEAFDETRPETAQEAVLKAVYEIGLEASRESDLHAMPTIGCETTTSEAIGPSRHIVVQHGGHEGTRDPDDGDRFPSDPPIRTRKGFLCACPIRRSGTEPVG
jgi:hypothetical protein